MTPTVLVMEKQASFYTNALEAAHPGVRLMAADDVQAALTTCADADALVALAPAVTQQLIDAMPRLRWIQALTTGTDHLDTLKLPADVIVTSARGIHGPQMAELAFLYMMALSRNLRRMIDNQAHAQWQRWPQPLLMNKTVVILGVGTISEEVALRCQAFGMRVIGVSSSRRHAPGFDDIVTRDDLHAAAARADVLIVLVPYTAATHHMVDAALLAAMKPDAVLINLARGSVIDEPALVEALGQGRIAAAGLDVFETEPLPASSPLWHMANVIVTPHIGGMSDNYAHQVLPLLVENIGIYAAGDSPALRNIVRHGVRA